MAAATTQGCLMRQHQQCQHQQQQVPLTQVAQQQMMRMHQLGGQHQQQQVPLMQAAQQQMMRMHQQQAMQTVQQQQAPMMQQVPAGPMDPMMHHNLQPVQAMMQQAPGGPMQPVMLVPVPFQPGALGAQGCPQRPPGFELVGPIAGALPSQMANAPASPATSPTATPLASPMPSGPPSPIASPTGTPPSFVRSPAAVRSGPSAARAAAQQRELCEGRREVLLQALEAGGQERQAALEAMRGCVRRLAFDEEGCRLVQMAIELDNRAATPLAREMQGCIQQACKSKHANFVVQKIIEVMPPSQSVFIAEELRGAAASVARNCYGCRVLRRLAEHNTPLVAELMEELLPAADKLCRHQYAHYVIESILKHGSADHRKRVSEAVRVECSTNARHKHAGHIMEKALIHCDLEEVQALVEVLVPTSQDARRKLAKDRCGRHVIMALLRITQTSEHGQRLIPAGVEAEFAAVLSKAPRSPYQ